MAYRLILEADTPEEFARLQQQFAAFVSGKAGAVRRPKERGIFRAADVAALKTLGESAAGLTTDELAQQLGIPKLNLPPVLNGWARRARSFGLKLDDLIERERAGDGSAKTIYRLTAQGRELILGTRMPPLHPDAELPEGSAALP